MDSGIYALVDPRDGKIYYIGQSSDFQIRYAWHVGAPKGGPEKWIEELRRLSLRPKMVILEELEGDRWERERRWIAWAVKHKQPIQNRNALLCQYKRG